MNMKNQRPNRPRLLGGAFVVSLLACLLVGCTAKPPEDASNLCSIFKEKRSWYKHASKAANRWNADIGSMMAIIYQESSFRARAKPPRRRLLWIIPWRRPASSYGYAQAIDSTWQMYQRESGRHGADRNDFSDAIDFVGWYNDTSRRRNRIGKADAYNLYLAYHEGHGGYTKNTHENKRWLTDVAQKVSSRADRYRTQLVSCEKNLKKGFWRRLFTRG